MKIHVEGYGCSMNISETEMIKGHAVSNGFELSSESDADFLVINTCAVKEQTDTNMIRRIKELNFVAEKNNSQLIVFGCLPKINPAVIEGISKNIVHIGPDLEKLSHVLGIKGESFSPAISPVRFNSAVIILPINSGCTNFCTFCGTKLARGNVKSHSIESIKKRFESSLPNSKEFWLTSQDTGAYGLDIKTSLPDLLESLLSVKGDFRIRIGMMNPHHLRRIYDRLIPLFSDERLYRFLHVPVQAGSDRILKLMRRGYTVNQYRDLINRLNNDVPGITVATDIIVGFPTETDSEFFETLSLVKDTLAPVVNISRFGARPNTVAASMDGQLHGRVKKERSRKITGVCRAVSYRQNKCMLGRIERVFVSERSPKGGFVGRTLNYKPVVLADAIFGSFYNVRITDVFPYYLIGEIVVEKSVPLRVKGNFS